MEPEGLPKRKPRGVAKPRAFEFTVPDTTIKVELVVFPNLKQLRAVVPDSKNLLALTRMFDPSCPVWVGLYVSKTMLDIGVLAHEAVHMAYAVGRRGENPWQDMFNHEEEERIAYPTGALLRAVLAVLQSNGYSIQGCPVLEPPAR